MGKAQKGKAAAKGGKSAKAPPKARRPEPRAAASRAKPAKSVPKAATKAAATPAKAPKPLPKSITDLAKVPPKTVAKSKPLSRAAAIAAAAQAQVERDEIIAKPTLKGKRALVKHSTIILPEGYRPSDDEPFMSDRHRMYFRNKLMTWKEDIIRQNRETLHVLHEDNAQHADLADRATSETDRALELRARDRQRKLIAKIDAALARIEDGSYGYCEETGEPIGLKRLDARPIATLSLEAQERHERRERVFRED
jgi:DnaK suppressor protein